MRILGTTIEIDRGEVFTLTRNLTDISGTPYILLSELENPFLLITVSSNLYEMEGRWSKKYWLDLRGYPKFNSSIPLYIESINNVPKTEDLNRVFYTMDLHGNREYFRYDSQSQTFKSYTFRFTKTFINNDTKDWIESIYTYQIQIVSGQKMLDWLTSNFISLFPNETPPLDNFTLYKRISKVRPDLTEGIDYSASLVNFNTKETLIKPSKLIIKAIA